MTRPWLRHYPPGVPEQIDADRWPSITHLIEDACDRLLSGQPLVADAPLVAAGVGRFLAADVAHRLARPCFEFARLLPDPGPELGRVSDCAPAVAVAWLVQREQG